MKPIAAVALAAIGAAALLLVVWRCNGDVALPLEVDNALALRSLPPNRWIKYHEEHPGWSRQGHAGIAYDSKRGTLLVFGSDTHGQNWDNAVHEFDPRRKGWETHQPASDPGTYRIDESGAPVAGTNALQPWAMHTYDGIEYHPGLDALVVMSTTWHTPEPGKLPRARRQPTWIYELSTRRWRTLDDSDARSPNFFAASSAFDARRGVLVAYRAGVWELNTTNRTWRKAPAQSRHDMHHTMVYDSRRGALFVFGDVRPTDVVWRYTPAATAGEAGEWTSHRPKGDACPPLSSAPVAFDAAADVFILVADNARGDPAAGKAATASTCLYDPEADAYTRLPDGDLPAVGMNYMMAWDRNHGVAFLVTGDWRGPVTVWALKVRKPSPAGARHGPP